MSEEQAAPKSGSEFVLECLSEATQQLLEPVRVGRFDHLVLSVEDGGRKFGANILALKPAASDSKRVSVKSFDGAEYEVWGSPSYSSLDLFKRIPECNWVGKQHSDYDKRDMRHFAATDFTALIIRHCWPRDRIIFTSEHARVMLDYLSLRFAAQTRVAETAARFKSMNIVPPLPDDWLEQPSLELSDYQRVAAQLAIGNESLALFMEQGTGKTPIVVQRVCMEAMRKTAKNPNGPPYFALIVCPPQVRLNWRNEFIRFGVAPGKVVVCRGGQLKRLKLLTRTIMKEPDSQFGVCIIGYDSLVESIDAFKKVPWDLVACDESHRFKSSSTQRWKIISQLRDSSKARMVLTGTPIGNSPMDLWTQLEFLADGASGFQTFAEFRRFHGTWVEGESGIERLAGIRNVPLLQERLARLSFQITKEEAGLKLPDKVPMVIEATMNAEQARWYQQLAEQLSLEIEEQLSGEVTAMTVENVLTKLLRLAQVTSGFLMFPEERDPAGAVIRQRSLKRVPGKNPKIEALVEMLTDEENDPRAKTVVWACWVDDIQHISERLTAEGIEHACYYGGTPMNERDDIVQRFNNDPKLKVLVCNAQTAGEGLNLLGYDRDDPNSNTYCDRAVFFSQNWSSILRSQAEDRVHRRGTKLPVRIIDLVCTGTIDEEIRERVVEKTRMAKSLTDVREILSRILGSIGAETEGA